MTSRGRNAGVKIMYGARSTRTVEPRESAPVSHLNSMPTRRASAYSAADRLSRGKAVDDDRIGRGDIRVTAGFIGKSRGVIDHADQFTSVERRNFRDEAMLKMVGRPDEALRGGASSKGPRALRSSAAYSDDPKWMSSSSRNGNYDNFSYDGLPSLRGSTDYTKSSGSTGAVLPGFILENQRRTILDFEQKGSFFLTLDDRRLAEQIGPGTKIFMLDSSARELHGVFQAESYAIDVDTASLRVSDGTALRVRVRIAKECIPLTERQFKEILEENYYNHSKLSAALTKEQVTKLLHSYRPADTGRNLHVTLPSSRRTLDPSLPMSSQDFHSIPDDLGYRKDWRRGAMDTRSFSSHSYQSQDATRFSSKLPVPSHTKEVFEYEEYDVDDVVDNIPLGSSRLVGSPNLYPSSRGKQHAFRTLPGSRAGVPQVVGNASHSELKLTDADWREEIDPRDLLYRKNRPLSPSSLEDMKRRDRSSSPPWKEVSEIYERPGKAAFKDEPSYLPSRRRRHNDIDLNMPLDMGHGEPAHLHDMDSKAVRRVWEEEEKEYSLSPSKGRPLLPHTSLRLSDHMVGDDDFDNLRMDSRHMENLSRKDIALLRRQVRARAVPGSFSNGKQGKLHPRAGPSESFPRDKPVTAPLLRKKPIPGRDIYSKESDLRSSRVPVFKIKANFQTPGRGRPERVVTFLNSAHPRPRLDGIVDKDGFRPWKASSDDYGNGSALGHGRKRKPSVWSRIVLPDKGLVQSAGRGRVFTRLGPNVNPAFKFRDDTYYPNKKQKVRLQQMESDLTLQRAHAHIEDSPDALEGEDYLNDDQDGSLEASDKETEKAADDLQGWTRKKAAFVAVNSGDESYNPDQGDYANVKGGRRKLVRPSIVAKGETDEGGWKQIESSPAAGEDHEKTSAQPRSGSDSMDVELAKVERQAAEEGDSPLGSPLNRNSPGDDHVEFEEDNMMS